MENKKIYPYKNYRFKVELGQIQIAAFREVTLPDSTQEPIEYREGSDEPTHTRQIPGPVKYGTITLKKGITDNLDLYEWRKRIEDGEVDRQNIAIELLDDKGDTACRWEFVSAWPSKYESPDLNATSNEIGIESLEIVHEGMTRMKL